MVQKRYRYLEEKLVNYLLRFSGKDYPIAYKMFSLLCGIIFFLIMLPAIFIFIGFLLKPYINWSLGFYPDILISVIFMIVGLLFLVWSAVTQWNKGKGTPAPNAPTRYLIAAGPYSLCRNPIQLGAMLYYLGVGILTGGLVVGVICFILGGIVGTLYHKLIEEKELLRRFGKEYLLYKEKVPFLVPRLCKWAN